jgi:hypothetical protein
MPDRYDTTRRSICQAHPEVESSPPDALAMPVSSEYAADGPPHGGAVDLPWEPPGSTFTIFSRRDVRDMDFGDIKDKLGEQKDKIEEGIDKAADFVKDKVSGHDDQIDTGAEKAKDFVEEQTNKPE